MPQNPPEPASIELDEQQRQVVAHDRGALRVLGAAGSGKTEALIAAVMARLAAGADRDTEQKSEPKVLVLAYDKHSAVELREVFARRIGTGTMPTVTTFHSLAWAIVRQAVQSEGGEVLRLLSGPEQDPRVRSMLAYAVSQGKLDLPEEFDHALGTQGLAEEVRRLFAKAQQLGISPVELEALGWTNGIDEWSGLGGFFADYLDATLAEGGIDYAAVLPRAAAVLEGQADDSGVAEEYVFDSIFVDEYHDVEPGQVALLRALVRLSPDLPFVVCGSPDEMIFRFRGTDPLAIVRFESDFADLSSVPPNTIALDNQYRFPKAIELAAKSVVAKVPLGSIPADAQRTLRSAWQEQPGANERARDPQPTVEVTSFLTVGAQYDQVAESIRRLKLSGEVESWSDIAVIARSATQGLRTLEQVLVSAGVPIVSLNGDVALREEPGVRELLMVVEAACAPTEISRENARSIALSPIGGLTPSEYRSLSRRLRDIASTRGEEPISAADAFAIALADPTRCQKLDGAGARKLQDLARMIKRVAAMVNTATAYEVLWEAWNSTDWPQQLHALATSPSSLARSAHRTLDAVMALFEVIRRSERVIGTSMSTEMLLDELHYQGFTPDSAQLDARADGVRLLSAHSAKGRSWPAVFVIDLQEDSWPRVAHSVSLLKTDRLTAGEPADPMSAVEQIRDERRLLYVALTRASKRLFVSCVSDDIESSRGASPSRFFNEITSLAQLEQVSGIVANLSQGSTAQSLTTASLVAQLRHVVEHPAASLELKHAAANRLGVLAQAGVRAADPETWWGVRQWSVPEQPVRDRGEPVRVSGSMWKDLDECALKWFLGREAGGETARGTATAFGSIIHALADAVARGEVAPYLDDLEAHVDLVWHKLGIESQWQNERERTVVKNALVRFLQWQDPEARGRKLITTESRFEGVIQTDLDADSPNVETQATIVGIADRLELDEAGRTVVVDLKNQKQAPSTKEVATHRQLMLYQLAVLAGAFEGELADWIPTESGGAELVQLRTSLVAPGPKLQPQPPYEFEELRLALGEPVDILRREDFKATPNDTVCRSCSFNLVCPAKSQGDEVVN